MGFARRLLSRVGIGAATVDTRLEKSEFAPGEEVRGVVEIKGGGTEQEIEGVYLAVQTYYKRESGDDTVTETGTIETTRIANKTTVGPDHAEETPFSFRLPYDTPLTVGRSAVWIQTGLEVTSAFDPSDQDRISVRPNATVRVILDAFERLGFDLREADNEELPHRLRRRLPFGQEFEFVARRGEFRGRLDELETLMFPDERGVDLIMQVDRRASGLGGFLSEAMGTDESYVQTTVTERDAASGADRVAEKLAGAIRRRA